MRPPRRCSTLTLSIALALSGCAEFTRPFSTPHQVEQIQAPPAADDAGVTFVDIEFDNPSLLRATPLEGAVTATPDTLPAVPVPLINIAESGVYDAIRLMLIAVAPGISVSIEGGPQGNERYGAVAAYGIQGLLPDVMERLSTMMGFFYRYQSGALFIQPDRQFVVSLPPALGADNLATLANTIAYLGARDTYLDRLGRTLAFRADRHALDKVEAYLRSVREQRPMIVYETTIYQVDLTDGNQTGIAWSAFNWQNAAASSASQTVAGSTASALDMSQAGFSYTGARFNMGVLLTFLRSQGTVKTLSAPRLTLMAGTKGNLRVGDTTRFVSKVGTNYSTNVNQVTMETEDLRTGLDITLFGELHDGTIYTSVALTLKDLVKYTNLTAQGINMTLPQTSDRDLSTLLRARPGDTMLLGGIQINRDSLDTSVGAAGTGTTVSTRRSELLLVIRPKLIQFKEVKAAKAALPASAKTADSVPATNPAISKPDPVAVLPRVTRAEGQPAAPAPAEKPVMTKAPELALQVTPVTSEPTPGAESPSVATAEGQPAVLAPAENPAPIKATEPALLVNPESRQPTPSDESPKGNATDGRPDSSVPVATAATTPESDVESTSAPAQHQPPSMPASTLVQSAPPPLLTPAFIATPEPTPPTPAAPATPTTVLELRSGASVRRSLQSFVRTHFGSSPLVWRIPNDLVVAESTSFVSDSASTVLSMALTSLGLETMTEPRVGDEIVVRTIRRH